MSSAVFIDRDGTINPDVKYLRRIRDFRFYPGVKRGIRRLREAGFKIIIITNQSGIARGYFTEKKLLQIHAWMSLELEKAGASVDSIYYCPHHPDDGCRCRKPATGMFRRAIREHGIVPGISYLIGDLDIDIAAGKRVGCRTVLVPEKGHKADVEKKLLERSISPDYSCGNFTEAVEWILGQPNPRLPRRARICKSSFRGKGRMR